jgi:undecaprenyl-diphosphatase
MDFLKSWDLGASYGMRSLHHDWLTPVMEFVTHIGDDRTLKIVVAVAVVLFVVLRRWRTACCVAAAWLLAYTLVDYGVKPWVNRPRPDLAWVTHRPTSPSFPSGHATLSMAVYASIALGLAAMLRDRRGWAAAAVAVGLGLPVLIGFTRMYLGLHYMSDVVGGFCAGLGCALFFAWLDRRWSEAARPAAPPAAEAHFRPATSQKGLEHIQQSGGQVQS